MENLNFKLTPEQTRIVVDALFAHTRKTWTDYEEKRSPNMKEWGKCDKVWRIFDRAYMNYWERKQRLIQEILKIKTIKKQKRIVKVDGYKFVDVTDIATLLYNTDIELFELDDNGFEHLIQSGKELERAIQTGMVVVECEVGKELNLIS